MHWQKIDPEYLSIFLLTYRSYMTPMELLTILIQRFNIENPANSDPQFLQYFHSHKRKPIQIRYYISSLNIIQLSIQSFNHSLLIMKINNLNNENNESNNNNINIIKERVMQLRDG